MTNRQNNMNKDPFKFFKRIETDKSWRPFHHRKGLPPFLRWPGGKKWIAKVIGPYWCRHNGLRYVDMFSGSLKLPLNLKPQRPSNVLANDINPYLINLYTRIKKGLKIDIEFKNTEEYYRERRDEFNNLITGDNPLTNRTALLFYYLNRTCFNGICRFNKSGKFNVPFGDNPPGYLSTFETYEKIFKSWEFTCMDFKDFFKIYVEEGDFLFVDPPYYTEDSSGFTDYFSESFEMEQQIQLVELIEQHNGPVIATNNVVPQIIELYKDHGFRIMEHDVQRRVDPRGKIKSVKEAIMTKNI